MSNSQNPYETAKLQLQKAYEKIQSAKYSPNILEVISSPDKFIEAHLRVRMDDGKVQTFTAYRSQHNNARWPYKGGIRYHESVTHDEVQALSIWMSIKCSVLDLPLGGGKGGIIVNPKNLSEKELEALSREYVKAFSKNLGPNQDVPAPDVNTNPKIMAWMADEYSKIKGEWTPGAFTWKPLEAGGSKWRWEATAQGGFYVLETYLNTRKDTISGKKVIIEGAGNAWLTMAKILSNAGAIIVGISDSSGAIYNKDGLSVDKISSLKRDKKSVTDYSGVEKISPDELLLKSADILIPAALENRITEENAAKIQAKLIIELANGPTTPKADEILFERGIPVIPDILANAWGVTVSYFEQVQNNTNYYWEESEVQEKLSKKMRESALSVFNESKTLSTDIRTAAYTLAIKRIADAIIARGIAS